MFCVASLKYLRGKGISPAKFSAGVGGSRRGQEVLAADTRNHALASCKSPHLHAYATTSSGCSCRTFRANCFRMVERFSWEAADRPVTRPFTTMRGGQGQMHGSKHRRGAGGAQRSPPQPRQQVASGAGVKRPHLVCCWRPRLPSRRRGRRNTGRLGCIRLGFCLPLPKMPHKQRLHRTKWEREGGACTEIRRDRRWKSAAQTFSTRSFIAHHSSIRATVFGFGVTGPSQGVASESPSISPWTSSSNSS
jgi:hypothetical protein